MADYNYSDYSTQTSFEVLHILDYLLLLVSVALIFFPLFRGISIQNAANENLQKEHDLKQISKALNFFYINSSNIPSERKYPTSQCSGQPNEVDYEYTLHNYLTGKRKNIDTASYINEADFPNDPFGVFSVKNSERKIKLRRCEQVFQNETQNDLVYNNGAKSCNFDLNNKETKYRNCYLYGTNTGGTKYQVSYYDQVTDKFVIFTRSRDDEVVRSTAAR
jgi:hypothetical protein